jgi:hypothetical protein
MTSSTAHIDGDYRYAASALAFPSTAAEMAPDTRSAARFPG